MPECGYKKLYEDYKVRFDIVWGWLLSSQEHYDGLLTRPELEVDLKRRLAEAVKASK